MTGSTRFYGFNSSFFVSFVLNNRAFLVFAILFLSLIFGNPVRAQNLSTLQGRDAVLIYEESLEPGAREINTIYPDVKKDLEKIFEWKIDFKPNVLLVKNGNAFRRMAGSSIVVAFAVPDKNLIVIDYTKMKSDPFTLDATLKHELCHLLLHEHIKTKNLPKWIDEGLCQWASGGLADIIMESKKTDLTGAILSGRYIAISKLASRFPRNATYMRLAYQESRDLVEYIIREYGFDSMILLLEHLKEGADLDTAVSGSLAIDFLDLEQEWIDSHRNRMAWARFLITNLYEILFFIAGLLLVIGFIRVILKKRDFDKLDEDDPDFINN